MYSFETEPAFRGATYSDELQMVHADTGAPVPFLPAIDGLTWRLMSMDRAAAWWPLYGYGGGPNYGNPAALLDDVAFVTLTLGNGLSITSVGTALWVLPPGQTARLCRPEYRMTLDLVRYGETCRVMDTVLNVER